MVGTPDQSQGDASRIGRSAAPVRPALLELLSQATPVSPKVAAIPNPVPCGRWHVVRRTSIAAAMSSPSAASRRRASRRSAVGRQKVDSGDVCRKPGQHRCWPFRIRAAETSTETSTDDPTGPSASGQGRSLKRRPPGPRITLKWRWSRVRMLWTPWRAARMQIEASARPIPRSR